MKKEKNYKVILIFCLLFAALSYSFSQNGKLPPFRIVDVKGNLFRAEDLPFNRPIMIIYFSPECEDCEALISDLLTNINDFRNVSIAMITFLPVDILKSFVLKNHIDQYPNIYSGTEGDLFFVRDYYKVLTLPFVALHNKSGDLLKIYRENFNMDEILKQINNP